ncbi:MAG: putative porin [Pseudomonadota bacterium]
MKGVKRPVLLGLAMLALAGPIFADEKEELLELRLTVVNLLQSLVERGVLTEADAAAMVADAQRSAAQVAAEQTTEADQLRDGDVRVTYVPEIVREQLREEIRAEIAAGVVADVKKDAAEEGWGIPESLPDWVDRITLGGDFRVRAEGLFFGADNARNTYLDFTAVNDAGGIDRAGINAIINTTEDRVRLRGAARFTIGSELSDSWYAYARIATGSIPNPLSRNQTLGRFGQTWQTNIDRAYLQWSPEPTGTFSQGVQVGRIFKPWPGTDLVWDNDVGFEGLYYDLTAAFDSERRDSLRVGLGYFAINEVDFTADDGFLASFDLLGRIGWGDDSNLFVNAAYYHYENITGIRNAPDSDLTDFTAPRRFQRGNTLFDIRNDLDPTTNLFALAAEYRLVNISTGFETTLASGMPLRFTADYVSNIGFDEADVLQNTGLSIRERTDGYAAYLLLGREELYERGEWSAEVGYRYLERDAVVDAFTDSNFGGGATDTQGYHLRMRYAFADDVWLDVRWLSSSEIDGPPLTIDSLLIDLNSRF